MSLIGRRALLVVPPTGLYNREERNQAKVDKLVVPSIRPPLDLCYIASMLRRKGVECKIVDFPTEGLSWLDMHRIIVDFRPESLIISSTSFTLSEDLKACSLAKRITPKIVTITKGAHVSVEDAETLKRHRDLDIIVRREYEETFDELVSNDREIEGIAGLSYRMNGNIFRNTDRSFISDLDSIPFPSRDLIDNTKYLRPDTLESMTTIQASRGCPNGCIFCLSDIVGGRILRKRSPLNILAEINECKGKFGINNFFFRADTFTSDRHWVRELCREIIATNLEIKWVCNGRVDTLDKETLLMMKNAGCWGIALGIESGIQDSLDRMGKHVTLEQSKNAVRLCKECSLKVLLYFMIGFHWEGEGHIRQTIKFAKELDGDFVEFNIAVPFPGTKYYELVKSRGLLISDTFEGYGYWKPISRTDYISSGRLLWLRKKAMIELYCSISRIYKTFHNVGSFNILKRYFKFGLMKLLKIIYE